MKSQNSGGDKISVVTKYDTFLFKSCEILEVGDLSINVENKKSLRARLSVSAENNCNNITLLYLENRLDSLLNRCYYYISTQDYIVVQNRVFAGQKLTVDSYRLFLFSTFNR